MGFPNTPVLDNFNRADGALGPNWNGPSFGDGNNLTISSNAVTSSNVSFSAMCWVAASVGTDFEVYMDLPVLPLPTGTSRVIVSNSATASTGLLGYYLVANPTTPSFQLSDAADGSNIGAAIAQAISAGDSFGFNRISGTITIWYRPSAGSWTALGTRNDSRYNGPFFIGIEMSDNTQRGDNFGGGTYVAMRKTLTPNGTRIGSRQVINI